MGSFCTSKPQVTTSNQSQTYTPNPKIEAAGSQALGMAESAAGQPFQMPAAPVAGFNPFQQQAFGQYHGLQGGTNPFFQNASANMGTAQSPVTQSDVAGFENPYADQALANMKKYVFDPQRVQTMGQATQAAGGVGADRLALTSQNLDKTQADALGQAQAGFYGQALGAAQQSKQQALQSAQGWANLGLGQQGAQLQATGALAGAGAQQQAQSQAELNSPYQQILAQIAYPYQQSQFLAGITGGLAGAMGGTTQGQGTQTMTPSQPSIFNQIAGLGMTGLGAYGAFGGFKQSNRGGAVYADGGPVNPWEIGQGFDIGGGVEEFSPDQFNRMDATAPDTFNERFLGEPTPPPEATAPMPFAPPPRARPNPWDATPVNAPTRMAQSPDRTGPYGPGSGGINSDMKIGDFEMPREKQPYPDSLKRDVGQDAVRSPWMGLVHAGAKMMQSTKSGIGGLGEGVEAGAQHLDLQRKELRSEQQINQKAQELYRHAQSELNKYTRKTPHELATEQESTRYHNILGTLGQSRIENQMATGNLIYAGPVKDEPGMGYFYDKKHLGPDGQPAVFKAPFDPGEKPGTAAKSGRIAAHELYKKLYPEDARGAQDILLGHKTMTRDDARKRVEAIVTKAMQAQPIQPGTTEWLEEHKRRADEMMSKITQEYGL